MPWQSDRIGSATKAQEALVASKTPTGWGTWLTRPFPPPSRAPQACGYGEGFFCAYISVIIAELRLIYLYGPVV